MFKFFRKYQRIIIIVGLPILLIIFLVPQAIQGIGDYVARNQRTEAEFTDPATGQVVGVSAAEYAEAQHELNVLTRGLGGINLGSIFRIGDINQASHWMLLVREAKNLGLVGGVDDARNLASQLAIGMSQSQQNPDAPIPTENDVFGTLAGNSSTSFQTVINTLTNIMGVQRMIQLYQGAGKISDRRLQYTAEDILQGIDARTLVITADALAEDLPEPTEEAMIAQMQKYADVVAGEGERGFGYRLPDRVQIEWLEIDPEAVRDAVETSDRLSRLEVRKYWLTHKDEFLSPGATNPNDVDFAQVESQVTQALLESITTETIESIVRFAEAEIARHTRELARDGTYYVLTDDWADRRMSYTDLAAEIEREFESGFPAYDARGNTWLSAREADLLPGIGFATTARFGTPLGLSELIDKLKEFGGDPLGQVNVQAGITGPTLRGRDGAAYFFRIFRTDESRPPASLDEVRDEVRNDLLSIADYERLLARKSEIETLAETRGMQAVADEFDTFMQPQRNIGLAPEGSFLTQMRLNATQWLPPVGRDEAAVKAIVHYAHTLMESMLAAGRSFDDLSISERTFVVEAADKLSLIVVELSDLRPLTRDRMASFLLPVADLILSEELGDDPMAFFSEDAVLARYQYESAGRSSDDEEDASDEEGDAATSTTE